MRSLHGCLTRGSLIILGLALAACGNAGVPGAAPGSAPPHNSTASSAPPESQPPVSTPATPEEGEGAPETQDPNGAGGSGGSAASLLPAPRGPLYRIGSKQWDYPVTMQGIAAESFTDLLGEPAPSDKEYVAVAVQIRGSLADRGAKPPPSYMLKIAWPDPDCRPIWGPDPYACNSERPEAMTGLLPVDAANYADPRQLGAGDVMPPGQPYNVIYKALVPSDFKLSKARLSMVTGEGYLPLSNLPEFPW